jgi:hypothetical protein
VARPADEQAVFGGAGIWRGAEAETVQEGWVMPAGAAMKFPTRDVADNMTVFAHLARQTPYRRAVLGMAERHRSHRFIEVDLPPGLVEELRLAVLAAMTLFGHAGWQRKEGASPTYGGFSLVYNPDHRDGLDPYVSTLGTPQNTGDEFFYNRRARNAPVKNSYFDTYSFRRWTPAAGHGALGTFLLALRRSPVRGRVGIIYGENVDPENEKYRASAGWHRDEMVYENLRVNIPLQTDDNFLFEIEGESPRHLAVGKAYSWDTHVPHRVYCCGPSKLQRIHLVLGVAPWFDFDPGEDAWQVNEFFGKLHPFDLLLNGRVHPLLGAEA